MDANNSEQNTALGIIWAIVVIVVIAILVLAAYLGINGAPKGNAGGAQNGMATKVAPHADIGAMSKVVSGISSSTVSAAAGSVDSTRDVVGANGAAGANATASASDGASVTTTGADGASGASMHANAASSAMVKVFFDKGKSIAPTTAANTLSSIVIYLKEHPSAKASIAGFHDASGNAVANEEVSKNRAKAVRDVLKAAGIVEDRVVLDKPQVTLAGDNASARRVEVSIHE